MRQRRHSGGENAVQRSSVHSAAVSNRCRLTAGVCRATAAPQLRTAARVAKARAVPARRLLSRNPSQHQSQRPSQRLSLPQVSTCRGSPATSGPALPSSSPAGAATLPPACHHDATAAAAAATAAPVIPAAEPVLKSVEAKEGKWVVARCFEGKVINTIVNPVYGRLAQNCRSKQSHA